MNIQYYDPYRKDTKDLDFSATGVSLEELLKTSDYNSINALLTPETRGLIGRQQLEMMKPTPFLINTSRGAIVDEEGLADILEQKKIRGAGLDFYGEHGDPPPKNSRLLKLDNVVLTPGDNPAGGVGRPHDLDLQEVRDRATYLDPHQLAAGMAYVLVNGQVAVEDGKFAGVLAGRVIRKNH